uniref:NADH-ubiquinone oxidoreductase chain 4 n=1 Tax=Plectrocnemia tsukuiensis TaxID=623670 RepID=A0A9E8LNL4_9NEOP|nr:NADH dehydrogenase subunit 4 [Plectrocnemia tsukuiensis]UZZ43698.1 NADH dehydrogenase subunit 4 [Plectrocnemia tsukuiensis]
MLMTLFSFFSLFLFILMHMNMWMILNCSFFFFFFMFIFNNMGILIFNISFILGIDLYSYGLILLSLWICLLNMLVSMNYYFYNDFFMLNNFFLLLILFLMFSSLNLFYFYIMFESSLFPIILMIIGWGFQVDRIQAGIYLMFYTLLFSLPMLVCIMKIEVFMGLLFMNLINNMNFLMIYLILLMSFLVKMPMFFIHLWLLKAHTEAPLGGSMILAGILLKMGGYGIIRILKFMFYLNLKFNIFWIVISLMGGVYMSFMCIIQLDMKMLIACSSVVHMSLVICGLMTMFFWGFNGSYILMIGHGLSSSSLFILVNCYYNLIMSRSLMINKGMLLMFPILSLWWFLMLISNMATPPSLNLLGEISLFSSILKWSLYNLILIMLMSFFSVVYSIYLYTFSQYNKFLGGMMVFLIGNYKDYIILFMHWMPLNLLILKVDFLFLLV